jgi:hypothetical protein
VTSRRRLARCCLALLVLGLGACSSSKKAVDVTTSLPATTTPTTPLIKVKLGPCPSVFPPIPLPKLNAGVQGITTKLVPIAATSVRVCRYAFPKLIAWGTIPSNAVSKFEADTNALPKATNRIDCPGETITRLYFVTFQNATQRVQVGGSDACGGNVGNGSFVAGKINGWVAEVTRAATTKA